MGRQCGEALDALEVGLRDRLGAGDEGAPVTVFKTPMSWLKAGGAGICILDWEWARDLLLDHELVAEDIELGNRLEAALKPEIWVMEAAHD